MGKRNLGIIDAQAGPAITRSTSLQLSQHYLDSVSIKQHALGLSTRSVETKGLAGSRSEEIASQSHDDKYYVKY